MTGVAAPDGNEGKSLLPVFTGKQKRIRGWIFTAYRDVQRAVRGERWKLIVYPRINKVQLFDLKNDPAETNDLAADPRHKGEVERLMQRLKDWQKQVGDGQPLRSEKTK